MMKKRILSIFLSLLTILLVMPTIHFSAQAADYSAELRSKGFPESYISALNALKQAHPNWNFEILKVGEDFSYAVSQERKSHSQQLIQNYSGNNGKGYYCTCSTCYKNGSYVVMEYPNWVSASQSAVEYYLDPRNFLDEQHIFQFESTLYNSNQTQTGVESILKGTWMYNANITYKDKNGATVTYSPATKYSKAIMDAAKYSGLSAYYLASKIVQEVGGTNPTAGGASGTYSGYPGIYNYYSIGANTGAADGLKWASYSPTGAHVQTSSGVAVNLRSQPSTSSSIVASVPSGTSVTTYSYTAVQSDGYKWVKLTNVSIGGKTYTGYIRSDYFVESAEKDTYNRPWTNPYLSIYNGAKWIANNFGTQYTGYLQKFNVNPASSSMHSHEYMANVQAAATEAVKTYTAYKNAGALNSAITFSIPVFNNMPNSSLAAPAMNAVKVNYDGSFTLSWSAVSGADAYEVYINSGTSYRLLKTTTATSLTTAIAAYGKQYSYKVRAVDSRYNVYSSYSNIVSAVNNVATSTLPAPTLNTVKVNTNGSFTLSWTAVSGADQYEVYINSAGSYRLLKTTTATSLTTAVAAYNKQYSYKVRAVDSKNNDYSAYSNVVSAINNKILPAPTMNAVKVNTNGSFTLSWGAVSGADKYEVYIDSTGSYRLLKTLTDTSLTTAVATYGKQYSYKVRAVYSKSNLYSDYSNVVTGVNNAVLPKPTFNTVKVNTNGSFTLSWTAVSGADQYEVYINSTGSYRLLKTTTETSLTTAVAAYGKQYSYKVRAVDSKNKAYSDYSNIVSGTNNKILPAPTMNAVKVNTNGSFTLSWTAVSGADKYEVYINSTGSYRLLKSLTATSLTTAVATYGKQYSYKVRAVYSKNNVYSDYSNIVTGINSKVLPTPTSVKLAINKSTPSFTISWNAVTGANAYEVWLRDSSGTYYKLRTVTATQVTLSNPKKSKQYTYKVRAIDTNTQAVSAYSSPISGIY